MKITRKKHLAVLLAAAVILSVFTGCSKTTHSEKPQNTQSEAENASGFTVNNEIYGENYEETFAAIPERIVSTSGFSTEMLLALGLGDKIAGYCYQDNEIYPEFEEEFSQLNCLSDTLPSKEALVALEPDFITGWVSAFSEGNFNPEFCSQNGIQIYVPQVEYAGVNMEKVYQDFENYGKIFGVEERAAEIIADMKAQIEDVQSAIEGTETARVFIYDSGEEECFTASAGLPTELIELAGGENVFAGTEKNWMSVSWEAVVEANPEYIIVMDYLASDSAEDKIEFLKSSEALKDVTAIKEDNIFVLGLTDVTGGIRNAEAVQVIAQNVHADCFE